MNYNLYHLSKYYFTAHIVLYTKGNKTISKLQSLTKYQKGLKTNKGRYKIISIEIRRTYNG